MDLNKIFIKDATPVKTGGQAVLDGIMMRGENRSSVVVRLPDGSMHIKTQEIKNDAKWKKVPVIRGAISFFSSLVLGMRVLMYSADVLNEYEIENHPEEGEPMPASWSSSTA